MSQIDTTRQENLSSVVCQQQSSDQPAHQRDVQSDQHLCYWLIGKDISRLLQSEFNYLASLCSCMQVCISRGQNILDPLNEHHFPSKNVICLEESRLYISNC